MQLLPPQRKSKVTLKKKFSLCWGRRFLSIISLINWRSKEQQHNHIKTRKDRSNSPLALRRFFFNQLLFFWQVIPTLPAVMSTTSNYPADVLNRSQTILPPRMSIQSVSPPRGTANLNRLPTTTRTKVAPKTAGSRWLSGQTKN